MTTPLLINSLIEWVNEGGDENILERVLWVDPKDDAVVVILMEDLQALPVWRKRSDIFKALEDGTVLKKVTDPFSLLSKPESDISVRDRMLRDKAWEVIGEIILVEPDIYLPEKRWSLVEGVMEKAKKSDIIIYKYLRKYWRGGKIKNALLPYYHHCGGGEHRNTTSSKKRGRPHKFASDNDQIFGINITADIQKIITASVKKYHFKEKLSLQKSYSKMLEAQFNVGYKTKDGERVPILRPDNELPSFGQFYYWFKKLFDIKTILNNTKGERKVNLENREMLSDSTQMSLGPGYIYQIDSTIANVYLVSGFDRALIIGRPVIYFIIDVFSRMCTGLYIGLEGPSWIGAMMALANAAFKKVEYCADYGIQITEEDWPCHYICECYLADRFEMISKASDQPANALGMRLDNTGPYRADLKGIVEQKFRRADVETILWLPGAVEARKKERGERDYRLDAALTIHEFTKDILEMVITYNRTHWMNWYPLDKDMIRERVDPIPIKLWEWGIANRSGHLREKDADLVRLNLMPQGVAKVTDSGLYFKGIYYASERALREQWFIKARTDKEWNVPISYDPRLVDIIYLRLEKNTIEPCYLTKRSAKYAGHTLEEVMDILEVIKMRAAAHKATVGRRAKVESGAVIDGVGKKAIEKTKTALGSERSNSERIKGIKKNRQEEKEHMRQEEAWDLTKKKESQANHNTSNVVSFRPELNEQRE
ncbi:MAG: Mu transposase C-terminal domain-containing protein, partial [Syntrophorhabdus sp.]